MQDYIIMTDSCCDLTDQMARELELEVLPLTMTMDGKEYPNTLDGRYITNEEFYKRLRAGKTSTTAAANVGQFEDAMRAVLGRGQDILCLCFSSALSTTYQSAVIAAENLAPDFPERTIRVIDTLSASRGQGLLVYLCAREKGQLRRMWFYVSTILSFHIGAASAYFAVELWEIKASLCALPFILWAYFMVVCEDRYRREHESAPA